MRIKRLSGLAAVAAVFCAQQVAAQYYHPVSVSGFTHDVIANGVGDANTTTTGAVDAVDFAYLSKDFQASSAHPMMTYGLPTTGQFMTLVTTTPGLTYQLGSYSATNSLKLIAANDSGTLTFATPTAAYNLYFLATGGSGTGVASATVNFSDGTAQSFSSLSIADWYGGANAAIQGIGRVNVTNNSLEDGGGINPRIYQIALAISAANQSKTVQSVTFSKVSGSGLINIFGISADKYTTCAAPTAVNASGVTVSNGTLNWTAPATAPTSYDIYYTSSTVAPNASTTPSQSGITGLTAPMSGLAAQTRFHVWIRSNCGGSLGEWAYGTTFLTPCSTFTVPYSENFDTTATGTSSNTNAPYCWSYAETSGFAGYGYVYATNPATAPNGYYLYNAAATTGDQMLVSPQTVALSDGTKRVKFSARAGTAGNTMQVGTLTNPSDVSTFVAFNTTTLTAVHTEYTVSIPSGGGSYLAFRHNLGGTYRSIYIDNIIVEASPSCLEPTNLSSSNIQSNGATVLWDASPSTPANGYEIYYSPINFAPNSSTVFNSSNSATSSNLNAILSGLTANTTYYFWVRAVCSGTNKSPWSYNSSFKTLCGPVTSIFENFDSYATGSIVPDCWGRLYTNGTMSISSVTPASGTRNIYQTNTSTQTPSVVVLPEFSNISAGTHRLRLKARVTVATGSLNIGYVTNPTDATTFVNIQTLSLANTTYTTGAEYTVDIPATVPATARLAIKNSADGKSYYWDDLYWESKNALATSETISKKKLSIYPNPFNNVLFISETENVKTVKVNDVAGRTLKVIENPTKEINLSSLNSGLYLITLYFKDGSQNTVKAIKK